ncbi:MAG: endonuclease domain-containing protein [Paludibacter sp.]|nr:endonuclease domain-containing protein [Paludibacter sp.]
MIDKQENIQNDTNFNSPLGVGGELGVRGIMFYGALPIHFELAKRLRGNQTDAEIFLWNHLVRIKIKGVRFKRQHPVLFFIADFYCHKAKLIIELDGGYHNIPEQYCYDRSRENELDELGLKVIRFTNEQVLDDIENVLRIIETEVKERLNNPQVY